MFFLFFLERVVTGYRQAAPARPICWKSNCIWPCKCSFLLIKKVAGRHKANQWLWPRTTPPPNERKYVTTSPKERGACMFSQFTVYTPENCHRWQGEREKVRLTLSTGLNFTGSVITRVKWSDHLNAEVPNCLWQYLLNEGVFTTNVCLCIMSCRVYAFFLYIVGMFSPHFFGHVVLIKQIIVICILNLFKCFFS